MKARTRAFTLTPSRSALLTRRAATAKNFSMARAMLKESLVTVRGLFLRGGLFLVKALRPGALPLFFVWHRRLYQVRGQISRKILRDDCGYLRLSGLSKYQASMSACGVQIIGGS